MDPEAIYLALIKRSQARIERSIDDLRTRRDQLIAEIQNVFKDVELGDGITLCEANVIDDYGTAEERARARETDQQIHWSQVEVDDVDPGASALSFIDATGFRFYLPAYLVFTLKHGFAEVFGEALVDSNNFECTIYKLNASMYGSVEACTHFRNRYSNFTRPERVCIARFLAFYAELEIDEDFDRVFEALNHDWGEYLPDKEYQHLKMIWPDRLT